MYNPDTELIFPERVILLLQKTRGEAWQELIDQVMASESNSLERVAFTLMMVRLGGCISCNSDSFRAMKGCTQCARQTVKRFRGSDLEMVVLFNQTRQEVLKHVKKTQAEKFNS